MLDHMRVAGLLTMVAAALCVTLAGCGDSGSSESSCVSQGTAKVCLVDIAGGVRVETSGLEPGSGLVVTSDLGPDPQTYPIGSDGRIQGAVGILGATPGDVTVKGRTANGESIEGEVKPPAKG
jgi:hypothetical protein